jgi:hypothetical protein
VGKATDPGKRRIAPKQQVHLLRLGGKAHQAGTDRAL